MAVAMAAFRDSEQVLLRVQEGMCILLVMMFSIFEEMPLASLPITMATGECSPVLRFCVYMLLPSKKAP